MFDERTKTYRSMEGLLNWKKLYVTELDFLFPRPLNINLFPKTQKLLNVNKLLLVE